MERLAHQRAGIFRETARRQRGQVAVHPVFQFVRKDAGRGALDRALCLVGDADDVGLRIGGSKLAAKRCIAELRGHPAFKGRGQLGASKVPGPGSLRLADRASGQHDNQW